MTDDLVKRLRAFEQWMRDPDDRNFTLSSDLFDEAADRIEELEAALKDPTLDMLIAGKKSLYSCSEDPELDDARKCFKAMVAALGEKTDG